MKVDEDLKTRILKETAPLMASASTAMLVAAVGALASYIGFNIKSSDMTGDKNVQPTKDDVSASKVEASAKDTGASLAKDEVKAKDGDLSAAKTDAVVSAGGATAMEAGATAARTKAGAADIETKALKMT